MLSASRRYVFKGRNKTYYVSNRKINIELHCLFVYMRQLECKQIYVEASATPRCCALHYGFKGMNKTYYVSNRKINIELHCLFVYMRQLECKQRYMLRQA